MPPSIHATTRCAVLRLRASKPRSVQQRAAFSVLDRPPPQYPGHVPLTKLERVGLAVGSGVMALLNPYRHDLIAALGEATAVPYFIYRLRDTMLADATGRRILRDRPRITSKQLGRLSAQDGNSDSGTGSVAAALRALPAGSVGRAYVEWLEREGVTADTRAAVRYIDDEECAYVMQRYRESHDFYHAVTGLPVVREGELALKALEFANTGLPVAALSLLAVATLRGPERARFFDLYLPWALRCGLRAKSLLNVYWEEQLGRGVEELRAELGIERPPDLRRMRAEEREERRRRRRQQQ